MEKANGGNGPEPRSGETAALPGWGQSPDGAQDGAAARLRGGRALPVRRRLREGPGRSALGRRPRRQRRGQPEPGVSTSSRWRRGRSLVPRMGGRTAPSSH